jgi:hypothetical protein
MRNLPPELAKTDLPRPRKFAFAGTRFAFCNAMPRYYFRLADGHLVANYGVHEFADDTAAQIAAIELARSVREARPELVGQGYSISVIDETGGDVCIIPLEMPAPD